MADSSDIDAAVIGVLQTDPTLKALLPDGVFMDAAPPGVKRFVLMGIEDSIDRPTYDRPRVVEEVLYFVKAVALSTAGANMKAAAHRIDTLLKDARLTTAPGYQEIYVHRARLEQPRLRDVEVDAIDASIQWLHRGGRYWAVATPLD
jgi:hypothetical protein